jgi:hypothetical protein
MQELPLGSFSFSFLLNNMGRLEVQSEIHILFSRPFG